MLGVRYLTTGKPGLQGDAIWVGTEGGVGEARSPPPLALTVFPWPPGAWAAEGSWGPLGAPGMEPLVPFEVLFKGNLGDPAGPRGA